MVYYLKKYNFTVYDTDVFNTIRTSYPQYLVQRPDIAEADSESSSMPMQAQSHLFLHLFFCPLSVTITNDRR